MFKILFASLVVCSLTFAESLPVQPIPAPEPLPAEVQMGVPSASQNGCRASNAAEVYTVKSLTKCGTRLPNSFLRGFVNRQRACTEEQLVAVAYAPLSNCRDCATHHQARCIRCERGDRCSCDDTAHLTCLVDQLTSPALEVRHAAARSLRLCGYSVTSRNQCVQSAVPSYALY